METARAIEQQLAKYGLDICIAFRSEFYNEQVATPGGHPLLPTLDAGPTLSLLIANTQTLWDHFTAHLKHDPSRLNAKNPLDEYVRNSIEASLQTVLGSNNSPQRSVRFAFEFGDKFVAFQRLGHVTGEAFYNSSCFISSHPQVGPWQAFRAVATILVSAADVPNEFDELGDPHPGGADRVAECMRQYFDVVKLAGGPRESGPKEIYRYLVAARDAATRPDQMQYRYSEEQIEYHYTKNRSVLRRCVEQDVK